MAAIALVAVALLSIEWRYQVIRTSPAVSHEAFLSEAPAVRLRIDPAAGADLTPEIVSHIAGIDAPRWLLRYVQPRSVSVTLTPEFQDREIGIDAFINPKRLGPVLRRASRDVLSGEAGSVRWDARSLERVAAGVYRVRGQFPLDRDAQDAMDFHWRQTPTRTSLGLDGGHFVEGYVDNRQGDGFLAFMSMLNAFEVDLEPKYREIAATTAKFVEEARIAADPSGSGALDLIVAFQFEPDARNKIGVIELKVALDDVFTEMVREVAQRHGIQAHGQGDWRGDALVYTYQFAQGARVITLLVQRKL